MNDTFSSAFLKGGIHDFQSIFSRKLISGEDSTAGVGTDI